MECYISNNGCVTKYVHDDGSETAIKTWEDGEESCGGSGRDKFNVFISSSVGCKIGCKFCYLTSKKFPHHELSDIQVANNVILAIEAEFKRRPELKTKPMNISFMGMGDAWLNLEGAYKVVSYILSWLDTTPIEGVDIATTMPQMNYKDIPILKKIERRLVESGRLTDRPPERTPVRIFYSLHSLFDETRRFLIPKTINVQSALSHLEDIRKHFNVIYHYMFLEGINDQHKDFSVIVDYFLWQPEKQLRILRYNQCPNSQFKESSDFDSQVKRLLLNRVDKNLKVQLSPGSEVAAACGMFLMKDITNEPTR